MFLKLPKCSMTQGARSGAPCLDLVVSDPLDAEPTLLCDVTVVQPTALSYLNLELQQPGASVQAAHDRKIQRYGRLAEVMHREFENDLWAETPLVTPLAVSSFGSFSKRTERFIEQVVHVYKRSLAALGPRLDGREPKQLMRSFRHRYKSDLQFAIHMGTARMMLKAGLPAFVCRHSELSRLRGTRSRIG